MRRLVAVLVFLTSVAHAGNDDSFFQGNEAAMMGGAVTAVGTGPGQLWYNPAALGINERNRLELSGSFFTLRVRSFEPFLDISVYDEDTLERLELIDERSERNVEFLSVPSALSYTRAIGDHVTAGFGIFVQSQDSLEADKRVSVVVPDLSLEYNRTLSFSLQRMFVGPGIGVKLGRLRLGASLFFVYDRFQLEEVSTLYGETVIDGIDTRAFASEEIRLDLRRLGLELVLGAQLELAPRWLAALVIRGPRIRLDDRVEVAFVGFEAVGDDTSSDFAVSESRAAASLNSETSVLAAPLEVTVSLGYRGDRLRLGFDAEFAHRYSGVFEYLFTWNVRVGLSYTASENIEIGFGAFTDRANLAGDGVLDFFIDWYGASIGVTAATPVGLRPSEDGPEQLIFRTTVALRYAFGRGDASGASADIAALDSDLDTYVFTFGPTQSVTFHEVGIYIGSGLAF